MPAAPHRHHLILTGICATITGLLVLVHLTSRQVAWLDQKVCDSLATRTFNPLARLSPPRSDLVFLGIDQSSKELDSVFPEDIEKSPALRLMKQAFPWNRAVYAHIAERLVNAGAAVVVFDIRFPNPRPGEGDDEFRVALEKYGDRVVIGSNLMDRDLSANVDSSTVSSTPVLELPARTLLPEGNPRDPRTGFVNVRADPDGLVRKVYFRTTQLEFAGKPPSESDPELLSLVSRALEKSGRGGLIPTTHSPVAIRFTDGIFTRSLYEIFDESMWAAPPYNEGRLFRGKTVFIGANGNEAEDRLATPFGNMLGPSVHLSALNAVLNHDFLRPTTPAENLVLIVAAGVLAWIVGAFIQHSFARICVIALTLLLYAALAVILFNTSGFTLTLMSPVLAFAGSGVTWTAWEAVIELRERQRTRRLMERYVSRDIVKELLDNRDSVLNLLGGERRHISVLFSDVRGFTSRTELADPHALVAQLNEYFNEMVRIVFAHQGTLDKFIGDAVMAHWGSITTEGKQTDALRAVRTAMDMIRALAKLNKEWITRGIEPMAVGIGVNHGEAIVGNIGCEEKMEVSAIGDAINTGSRLEGVTKPYHLDMVIGEEVANFVRDEFIIRSVDLIKVKGKYRPIQVFTVVGERKTAAEPEWLAKHEEAMRLYRAGSFAAAQAAWQEVLSQSPEDSLADTFAQRCKALQEHPPEGEWNGVYEMTTK